MSKTDNRCFAGEEMKDEKENVEKKMKYNKKRRRRRRKDRNKVLAVLSTDSFLNDDDELI